MEKLYTIIPDITGIKGTIFDLEVFKESLLKLYLEYRSQICNIFNDKIPSINEEWDKTGKPCSFGDYIEDMNPEYSKFIKDRILPEIQEFNNKLDKYPIEYYLDDYCDIRAKLKAKPEITIGVWLKEKE
jgi:hypothetical protein